MKKDDIYQRRRHNKNLLMVHLIFVTKYRKSLLTGNIRETVKRSIYKTCVENHWYLKRMETDKDHIHILLQYPPTVSITQIVSVLKQYSTDTVWKTYRSFLRQYYWYKDIFWSSGYFAASIGQVSQSTIERYIDEQG